MTRYERLVFSFPLSYGLSRDDAADIAQLTCTILLQSLDALHEGSHLGAWLATRARRHTWRLVRRSRHETAVEDDELERATVQLPGHAEAVERWEAVVWLHDGLARIDARCRELLTALYLAEPPASYGAVATQFGIPLGSIGPTRARCLERLKRLLSDR